MDPDDKTRWKALNQAAAEWAARLSSDSCADADRQALEAWLKQDPAHEVAYLRAEAVSKTMDRLRALRPAGGADPDLLAKPSSLRWSAPLGSVPAPAKSRPAFTRRAAAGLVLAGLAGGAYLGFGRTSKAYATAVGQQMSIPLGEGGRLELNTDSRVELAGGDNPRFARLAYGEALFTLGRRRAESFIVKVEGHKLQAAAGAGVFDLRRDAGSVRILVMEGQVRLSGAPAGGGPRFELTLPAGSQTAIDANGPRTRRETPDDLNRRLSWRLGAISFAGEPLSEAVEEFNRYNASKMAVTDPALRDLRIGGYFQANDPAAFAKAVELTFGVRAVDRAGVLTFVAG